MSEKATVLGFIVDWNTLAANDLIGKLATLADASIGNDRQAKAFKDTLKGIVWESEDRRYKAISRELYSCKQKGTPMMSDNAEQAIKARVEAERGILEKS